MLKRFNRWLVWQIRYHQDKKCAPEILDRIRRERGLSPQGEGSGAGKVAADGARSALGFLLFTKAAKTTVSAPPPRA